MMPNNAGKRRFIRAMPVPPADELKIIENKGVGAIYAEIPNRFRGSI
jgi:hypothetical protein